MLSPSNANGNASSPPSSSSMDIFSPRDDRSSLDLDDWDFQKGLEEVPTEHHTPRSNGFLDGSQWNARNVLDGLQGKGPLGDKRCMIVGVPVMAALVCVIVVFVLVLLMYPLVHGTTSDSSDSGGGGGGDVLHAPYQFIVDVQTTVSNASQSSFQLNISREFSPRGVDRFYQLVRNGYYNNNGFFRVVPNFVVQFGINGNPSVSAEWENKTILDDPVVISNTIGTIAFATDGNDTRSTQLFINTGNNSHLDAMGFSPFGHVMGSGMDVVLNINAEYGQEPNQSQIYQKGNDYLQQHFPNLDYITSMSIVEQS